MASGKKKIGSAGRFGARLGGRIRQKISRVEAKLRKKHTCPSCQNDTLKRIASGIWLCKKCNHKFAGKAYSPGE